MDVARLKLYRDKALVLIYQHGMTDISGSYSMHALLKKLGLTELEFRPVMNAMINLGLLDFTHCPVGSIKLSFTGQREAERLDQRIALRPVPPPPAPGVVVNNVSNSPNSTIQQGGHHASQRATGNWNPQHLRNAIDAVAANADAMNLSDDRLAELNETISALRDALDASMKPSFLRTLGNAASRLLAEAASPLGASLGQQLAEAIRDIPG